jgi:hypothetical protein
MTKSERRQVAATLREWAAWCEANRGKDFYGYALWNSLGNAWILGCAFCYGSYSYESLSGPTAATGLLLAAAMVEAGDVP